LKPLNLQRTQIRSIRLPAWYITVWRICLVRWLKHLHLPSTNATLPYAIEIANKGWKRAFKENPEIKRGANVVKGKVTYRGVAEAFGLEYVPVGSLL